MRGNLKLGKSRENIELRDIDRRKSIELVTEFDDVKVEPAASSWSAGSGTKLMADPLEPLTNFVELLRGEGAAADASGIRLHDTNLGLYRLRWHTKSSADSTDSRI